MYSCMAMMAQAYPSKSSMISFPDHPQVNKLGAHFDDKQTGGGNYTTASSNVYIGQITTHQFSWIIQATGKESTFTAS